MAWNKSKSNNLLQKIINYFGFFLSRALHTSRDIYIRVKFICTTIHICIIFFKLNFVYVLLHSFVYDMTYDKSLERCRLAFTLIGDQMLCRVSF